MYPLVHSTREYHTLEQKTGTILNYMQEQIHKEIDLTKEKLSSDDIERHSFNVEGLKLLAGFSISRHWDIVVSRACKRDMLRRMLCRKDGEAVRWSFVEDLEQILEMNVTSAVPERINISSMKKEFVDLLTPSSRRKAHYNRTWCSTAFLIHLLRGLARVTCSPFSLYRIPHSQ